MKLKKELSYISTPPLGLPGLLPLSFTAISTMQTTHGNGTKHRYVKIELSGFICGGNNIVIILLYPWRRYQ